MATNRYQGVDPILTNISIGYQNDEYIAEQLLPSIPVAKQTGKHFIYDRGRFRNTPSKRGTGAPSGEVTLNLTTGLPYYAEDHALKEFVPDEDVDNAVAPADPFADATENTTERLMVAREVEAATLLTSTGNMTQNTTLSGTSQWSDSNSDPIADMRTGMQTVHSAIFQNPNTLVLGKQVWNKLIDHPAFIERVKYSQLGSVTTDLVARLIGVDRVIIGAAGKNTSTEGQTDAMSYIWGKDAFLAYINPRPAVKTVTLGITYRWKQRQVERLRGSDEEDRKGTYVRVGEDYYDQNIVSASCAYLIKNAVA